MTPDIETKHTPDLKTAQMRELKADFASTFSAFRESNDARLAEIEAKSSADPLLTDKVNRINAALDAQTRQIENLTLAGARPGALSVAPSEAKSAWAGFIRTGDASALEGKSLTSVDGEGGLIAPVETETQIDAALLEASPMRRLAIRKIYQNSHRVCRKPRTYWTTPMTPPSSASLMVSCKKPFAPVPPIFMLNPMKNGCLCAFALTAR